uniref:Uncharacterized protein n=2 Tax=Cacopsylla melanoneura TaxID=428564 RepID=A0A8D8TX86_9HEMI
MCPPFSYHSRFSSRMSTPTAGVAPVEEAPTEAKRLCRLEERSEKLENIMSQILTAISNRKIPSQSVATSTPSGSSAAPTDCSGPASAVPPPVCTASSGAPVSTPGLAQAPVPQSTTQTVQAHAGSCVGPTPTFPSYPGAAHLYPGQAPYGFPMGSFPSAPLGFMPTAAAAAPPAQGSAHPCGHAFPDPPSDREEEESSGDENSDTLSWRAPALLSPGFSFSPETKEREPSIPLPAPDILEQGINCQKLGSAGWSRVRYMEAQKALQAGGMFSALTIPPDFPSSCRSSADHSARLDLSLGTLTHGLLLQRKAFSEGVNTLLEKVPNAAGEILRIFGSPESPFKLVSDNLLQYTCGKRAECFELRRKQLEPKDPHMARLMRDIPPSSTALFEEGKLSEFVRAHPAAIRSKPRNVPRPPPPASAMDLPFLSQRKERLQAPRFRSTKVPGATAPPRSKFNKFPKKNNR